MGTEMAWYKYDQFLTKSVDGGYDKIYSPGTAAPHAGIYRCDGCGREIGIAETHILPPQSHHQHTTAQGDIRWRLIVYADHRPESDRK
jgi:hypothetical protein